MEVIYHYTTGMKMPMILQSEKLIVSPFERSMKHIKKPALWLSRNPHWEPTSAKRIQMSDGTQRLLTMEEHTEELVGGLFRFLLPFEKNMYCSWAKYKYQAKINEAEYYGLERIGKQQGANPSDWYASFKDISLEYVLTIETWEENNWKDIVNH